MRKMCLLMAAGLALCCLAAGLQIESVGEAVFIDGLAFELISENVSSNGTVTLVLRPLPADAFIPGLDDQTVYDEPSERPGHYLTSTPNVTVTWGSGHYDDEGNDIPDEEGGEPSGEVRIVNLSD